MTTRLPRSADVEGTAAPARADMASPPAAPVAGTEAAAGDQAGARSDRRGPMRPAELVSTRTRQEAASLQRMLRAVEIGIIVAAALGASKAFHPAGLLSAPVGAVLPLVVGVLCLIWGLRVARAASIGRVEHLSSALGRVASALVASGLAAGILLAVLEPSPDVVLFTCIWFAISAATVITAQVLWWRRVKAWHAAGRLTPNVVVVGATQNARTLVERAKVSGQVAVLGIFDDRLDRAPPDIAGVPVLGDTEALLTHRIMPYVDRVVIAVPPHAQGRVRQLIERLRVLPNEIYLFLDFEGEAAQSAALSRLAETPMARLSGAGQDESRLFAKRMQDLVVASLALIPLLPVMALIAVAVKLDSRGPVFFRQRRHGLNNEAIVVWKFRSMRHEAADPTAARQVARDDKRVTRVGRILRKSSLDELPQIFNVLKGEMSIVGPRPHAIGMRTGDVESEKLVAEYAWRHRMKPGMTGWAAVCGSRGPIHTAEDVRRRVELDVEYIERQSVWFDLYIIVMTLPCLLGDSEAIR
ncbi:MAG TPA: exopolysaccharide biosynthesis polyprenyl glycosylphosphotransferase [Rhodopila sp.]|uniref:exopolysaccharide biosynthesis polyprenyl glycosylphosphotransferase n=1 Tax=Rhodopila sp. TaxID=2480087 RepID=UPI002BFCCE7F|nr:exopolysaccharide biosynthesis polyprenyl glycosylphosphotransferase [Rhodopila sp.]HVY16830.1 exopolysaccharide biosynthesis polyprenyl glycosylphosphotransferase [Rhodopila sp.]